MDYIRSESESDILNTAGLRGEEDYLVLRMEERKNRWMWLALNLCTAFFASRVIGRIRKIPSKTCRARGTNANRRAAHCWQLANQTATIIIRSLALGQLNQANARRLIGKEITIAD